jgi:glycosyltransferase involved in cell wall biosynthesis
MSSEAAPRFTIVTPSFRSGAWLKLCIASVADQAGPSCEHIVQDAVSDDGTLDWLPNDTRVTAVIEKDSGMYDAVNRGYRRARGEILAYLNCDEQYLPGALEVVSKYFDEHPEIDVLFADAVITDSDGEYICHRYSMKPIPAYIWLRFPLLTCSIFIRRRVVSEYGILFDTQWKDLGDTIWVGELLRRKISIGILRHFTSIFTDTGENMNLLANAQREKKIVRDRAAAWSRALAPLAILHHRFRMVLSGVFFQKPFDYALYTRTSPTTRVVKHVKHPSAIWTGRV